MVDGCVRECSAVFVMITIYNKLIIPLQAEKEAAELRRDIKSLKAHVEAKANFMDAFDQLQNLPLVDGKAAFRSSG